MGDRFLISFLKWFGISIVVGNIFGIGWAIIFWNNDSLFIWHWLALPLAILIMAYGGFVSFAYKGENIE